MRSRAPTPWPPAAAPTPARNVSHLGKPRRRAGRPWAWREVAQGGRQGAHPAHPVPSRPRRQSPGRAAPGGGGRRDRNRRPSRGDGEASPSSPTPLPSPVPGALQGPRPVAASARASASVRSQGPPPQAAPHHGAAANPRTHFADEETEATLLQGDQICSWSLGLPAARGGEPDARARVSWRANPSWLMNRLVSASSLITAPHGLVYPRAAAGPRERPWGPGCR